MLTRLHLENFKSWQDTQDIALRPFTGFFGANSSGKSGLIHALLLLKQTADSADRGIVFHFGGPATRVDLGDFESVVHRFVGDSVLGISLDWRTEKPFRITDTYARRDVASSNDIGFRVVARMEESRSHDQLVVKEMSYRVGDAEFGMCRASGRKYDTFIKNVDFQFRRHRGRPWDITAPVKCYGFPDSVRANYQNAGFLAGLEYVLEQKLQNVYYLGPLRAYPQRVYTWSGGQPMDMGETGEAVVDALLAARQQGQMIGRGRGRRRLTLEAYVAKWLKDLGLIHDFRVEPVAEGSRLFEVRVRKSPKAAEVLLTDVGFGVSQILPVLVLCFYVPEGSTVILEQPEIHLHPSVQAGLADVFIDAWEKRKVQVIVESHSEHLLRRLQRRIAEKKLSQDNVGLYFCKEEDGVSRLDSLEIDLFGNISNWPQDFFGDQFGEIAAMSEAALMRRQAAG
ncbi:MAG: DUF3696 domain-containing protein [Caldilineaceae bacterium SB0668_bin_21]|nr:DUF3696 domain-containing protein [Caldilineaceae bacterium SB0668_bin_21]MYC22837.1 DUF3696 domain-containing protein [Caldilineaceae bacterium SB0662_bin_25]